MANGQDNSGKPSPGAGLPRIAPAVPQASPMPRVTAPQNPPLVPQVTPAQARPPTAAPAVARPPSAGSPGSPPPGARPPASSPSQVVAPSRPNPPQISAAPPARPALPVVTPAAGQPRGHAGVPTVAPPQAARPGAPSGPLVMGQAPARPAGAPAVAQPQAAGPRAPLPPTVGAAPFIPPKPGALSSPPAAGPARLGPLPPTGAVDVITPQQAAGLSKLADSLDTIDYFEALGVHQGALPADIKKAFYRESRTYHPDRFFHLPESQVKEDIGSIYKRMTEAYYVLRDDAKRRKYLADVTGPDRASKLRYTEATESELKAEARKSVEEEFGTNPKARPYFKTALAELDKGNWTAAIGALKTGLMYEPGNTRFKEKLAEAQKKAEDARKGASGFMIK